MSIVTESETFKHSFPCYQIDGILFNGVKLLDENRSKMLELSNVAVDTDIICYKIEDDGDLFILDKLLLVRECDIHKFKKEYYKIKKRDKNVKVRYVTRIYTANYQNSERCKRKTFRKYLL